MELPILERHFEKIGARAKIRAWSLNDRSARLTIDIRRDRNGEYFDLAIPQDQALRTQILDVQTSLRHLLLMTEHEDSKQKFLCGHDERHWFVAAVPERARVTSVTAAFAALKPSAVRQREEQLRVKPGKRNRRRNDAFVRQGEWFFLPVEQEREIDARVALRNEPISRGRGKPHYCDELVRQGGELVYVCSQYPTGVTESQRQAMLERSPNLRYLRWTAMRRNPEVFIRGRVRHADHKTIFLDGWHRVLMNTENESIAMRNVAFID